MADQTASLEIEFDYSDAPEVIDIRGFRIDLGQLSGFDRFLQRISIAGYLVAETGRKLGLAIADTAPDTLKR